MKIHQLTRFYNYGAASFQRLTVSSCDWEHSIESLYQSLTGRLLVISPFRHSGVTLKHSLWSRDKFVGNLEMYGSVESQLNGLNREYEAIFIYGALEALEDPRALLKSITGLCRARPSTKVIIRALRDSDFYEGSFYRRYSTEEITKVFESIGFARMGNQQDNISLSYSKSQEKLHVYSTVRRITIEQRADANLSITFHGANKKECAIEELLSDEALAYLRANDHGSYGDATVEAVKLCLLLCASLSEVECGDGEANAMRLLQARSTGLLPTRLKIKTNSKASLLLKAERNTSYVQPEDLELFQRELFGLANSDEVNFSTDSDREIHGSYGIEFKKHGMLSAPGANDVTIDGSRVSIIVPCHNISLSHIAELCRSLESQSCPAGEVIFIDDGSTPPHYTRRLKQTIEKNYTHKFIVVRQENRGVSGARNSGLHRAGKDFVLLIDPDDIAGNYYLETMLRAKLLNPDAIAVTPYLTDFVDGRDDGSLVHLGANEYHPTGSSLATPFFPSNFFGSAAGLFEREHLLEATGGWESSDKAIWEDWSLYLRLKCMGHKTIVVPQRLYAYRRRMDSLINTMPEGEGAKKLIRNYTLMSCADAYMLYVQQKYINNIRHGHYPEVLVRDILDKEGSNVIQEWLSSHKLLKIARKVARYTSSRNKGKKL